MGLISRINRAVFYTMEPFRKVHPIDRGYVKRGADVVAFMNEQDEGLEPPKLAFPARATLPPRTIISSYPTHGNDQSGSEIETMSERYTVHFPPMILDTKGRAEIYLRNLSAPVPEDSLFQDAVIQPDGINLENLDRFNQAYASKLRQSSYAARNRFASEIDDLANRLSQMTDRLNDETLKRYEAYDDNHRDNAQARYLSQAQAQLVVADEMRKLSEQAHRVAKRRGIDPEARIAFGNLGNYFDTIKRHHVSQASVGLLKDDSEYKQAQGQLDPVAQNHRSIPGADSQTRMTTGPKFGVKKGISGLVNGRLGLLAGWTSFMQKSTGRDLETSVVKTSGPSVNLNGDLTFGGESATARAFFDANAAQTIGTQFKAENPPDRDEGESKLDELKRKNILFKGAGPRLRSITSGWQNAKNTFGRELAGTPGKSPDQPFFVTAEKVGHRKFNQQEILDTAKEVDRYFNSNEDAVETFEALSSIYHPTLAERFRRIDEIAAQRDLKSSDIEKHAPGMYYPGSISGMPASRYNNSRNVRGPAHQKDFSLSGGMQAKASGFDAKLVPGKVEPAPVAPNVDFQLTGAGRYASNTQQRHKPLIDMAAPGKLLPGDIYSILARTKKVYDDSNPRASGGHPLHRARDLYTLATLGLEDIEVAAKWEPADEERGFYGDARNIPLPVRQAIVAMRDVDPARGEKLDALKPLNETTRHLKSIESELEKFYVDATTVNPHFDSPKGRIELEAMNQRYAGGGYRFPDKVKRRDMYDFFNAVHNDFTGSIVATAVDGAVMTYEGVRQLRDAPEEKKAEFRQAVEKNRQAYSTASRLELQDYLPPSIIDQRKGDVAAVGRSAKKEYRVRATASASFGITNDTGQVGDYLKVNANGPRYSAFAEIRKIEQEENINPLRLGTMYAVTLTGSEGGHVHTGLGALIPKFKNDERERIMGDVMKATPLDLLFGKQGTGIEYQLWVPDTSSLPDPDRKVASSVARRTTMEFQSKSVEISPLDRLVEGITGLPIVAALSTRYGQEDKIPLDTQIGPVPSEAILAFNKAGPNFGDKATGKMHPFEDIEANLRGEGRVHRDAFFSGYNAIPKIVHLFQQAAIDESDTPYNDFHNLLYGYQLSGKNVRGNMLAAAHYSPVSKADPFDAPPLDRDLYQDLIDEAKGADWPKYDAGLVERLGRMSPDEQLHFYTSDPQGQRILETFWNVVNTANKHLSVLKGADQIGYTMVPHERLIRRLPVKDENDPGASEKSVLQRMGRDAADFFTGYAGFRALPMPPTAVHGNRRVPVLPTRMVFPSPLDSVEEERSRNEPSIRVDVERTASVSDVRSTPPLAMQGIPGQQDPSRVSDASSNSMAPPPMAIAPVDSSVGDPASIAMPLHTGSGPLPGTTSTLPHAPINPQAGVDNAGSVLQALVIQPSQPDRQPVNDLANAMVGSSVPVSESGSGTASSQTPPQVLLATADSQPLVASQSVPPMAAGSTPAEAFRPVPMAKPQDTQSLTTSHFGALLGTGMTSLGQGPGQSSPLPVPAPATSNAQGAELPSQVTFF